MRSTSTALVLFSFLLVAAPALAGAVNPVANGDFELFVPFGAAAMQGTPAEGTGFGVGRQILGCTRSANIVWQEDCTGADRDPATEAMAIAADPQTEIAAWTAPGARNGDLVIVAPQNQGIWYAADWTIFPTDSVAFGDQDGDGDREAKILPGNQMLYQSFGSASPHTAIPAGTIQAITADLEAGAPAGSFVFVLDSFPLESARDWPQAFINYQLHMPASRWSVVDGAASIDPLTGSLSGPAAGAYLFGDHECVDDALPCVDVPPGVDDHPTVAQWNAADRDGRRAMLMEFRVVQMTFWNLQPGTQLDNVAWDIGV